eukprot:779993-Pyramimonas_sp.AAC.1
MTVYLPEEDAAIRARNALAERAARASTPPVHQYCTAPVLLLHCSCTAPLLYCTCDGHPPAVAPPIVSAARTPLPF